MMVSQLKKEVVKAFMKSLNPNSKFLKQDAQVFSLKIKGENNKARLKSQLNNMRCLNGSNPSFNKEIKKIIKELDNAGMFAVKELGSKNALD